MKKAVDIVMVIVLLFLMAYQVTGEKLHEWTGITMTVLVIVHQILNRRWYGGLFRGKYNIYRIVSTVSNFLLLASFALTAFCGMSMSAYAVPFLYGMADSAFAQRFHLAMSHWTFILMGCHLGLHVPAMIPRQRTSKAAGMILSLLFACLAGYGLFLFLRSGIPDYLFFRVPFAFLDYDKAKWLVILENLLMLISWVFIGAQIADLCLSRAGKRNPLIPVVFIITALIIALIFGQAVRGADAAVCDGWGIEYIPMAVSS